MSTRPRNKASGPGGGEQRIPAAKANLEKLEETIAPYIKRRRFSTVSTAGQWSEKPGSSSRAGTPQEPEKGS